jgi:hypothetical protein
MERSRSRTPIIMPMGPPVCFWPFSKPGVVFYDLEIILKRILHKKVFFAKGIVADWAQQGDT